MCSVNDFPPYDDESDNLEDDPKGSNYVTDSILDAYPIHAGAFAEEILNLDSSNTLSAMEKLNLIATKIIGHSFCFWCTTEGMV